MYKIVALGLSVLLLLGGYAKSQQAPPPEPPPPTADTIPEPTPAPPQPDSTPSPFSTVAYIPTLSEIAQGELMEASYDHLTDAILIGGAVWDAENKVAIVNDNYSVAVKNIRTAIGTRPVRVWTTLAPVNSLMKADAVGAGLDSPAELETLAQSITEFAVQNNLDGIDIDWEYPANTAEWKGFSDLIVVLAPKLHAEEKGLSLAFYPREVELSAEAIALVDRINIMCYDLFDEEGRHTTYQSAQESVDYFLSLGFVPKQLCLGIPLYGRPTDRTARWDLYKDIPITSNPDENLYNGSYFNGRTLIAQKTAYAASRELEGVMLYHLYCDLPATDENSALLAVAGKLEELGLRAKP